VLVQPVTASWAQVTVAGPRAWDLLSVAGFDTVLAPANTRHMTMIRSAWRGHPVRVLWASFSGELGHEGNLRPSAAESLLHTLWQKGEALGACAYGVEALMILRIEKGFLHVGAIPMAPRCRAMSDCRARWSARRRTSSGGGRCCKRPQAMPTDCDSWGCSPWTAAHGRPWGRTCPDARHPPWPKGM